MEDEMAGMRKELESRPKNAQEGDQSDGLPEKKRLEIVIKDKE